MSTTDSAANEASRDEASGSERSERRASTAASAGGSTDAEPESEANPDDEPALAPGALADQPPSAKLVAKVLEHEGTLTQGQLAEHTQLPPRTVRYAIGRLEDAGVVESRFSFVDARQRVYTLRAN